MPIILLVFFLYCPKSWDFSKPLRPFHKLLILPYFSLFLSSPIFSVSYLASLIPVASHYKHISCIAPDLPSLSLWTGKYSPVKYDASCTLYLYLNRWRWWQENTQLFWQIFKSMVTHLKSSPQCYLNILLHFPMIFTFIIPHDIHYFYRSIVYTFSPLSNLHIFLILILSW